MEYYGLKELKKLTKLPHGTLFSRLYNKRRAKKYGVETVNGRRVVSEVNFKKFGWKNHFKSGRPITVLSICCDAPVVDRLFDGRILVSICQNCHRVCNKYEPQENIKKG